MAIDIRVSYNLPQAPNATIDSDKCYFQPSYPINLQKLSLLFDVQPIALYLDPFVHQMMQDIVYHKSIDMLSQIKVSQPS